MTMNYRESSETRDDNFNMDKREVHHLLITHKGNDYRVVLLWEEGTDNYSVELWDNLNLLLALDWLLKGQAEESFASIIENIDEYIDDEES